MHATTVAGQVFALFVIAIAAAEVGVGLAIVLLIYRNRAAHRPRRGRPDEGLGDARHARCSSNAWRHPAAAGVSFVADPVLRQAAADKGAEIGIAAVGLAFVLA